MVICKFCYKAYGISCKTNYMTGNGQFPQFSKFSTRGARGIFSRAWDKNGHFSFSPLVFPGVKYLFPVEKKISILIDPKQISVVLKKKRRRGGGGGGPGGGGGRRRKKKKKKKKKKKRRRKKKKKVLSSFCNFPFHFQFSTFPFPFSIFLLFFCIFQFFLVSLFPVSQQKFPGEKYQGVPPPRLLRHYFQHHMGSREFAWIEIPTLGIWCK